MISLIQEADKRKEAIQNHINLWLNCDITREDLIYILSFRYGYTETQIKNLIERLK